VQNHIYFETQKNPGFPIFFSATQNLGFKILPQIGNTSAELFWRQCED